MLTYDDYVLLGGVLSKEVYPAFEARAARRLDRATFGRLRDEWPLRECVKRCLKELIDLYARQAEVGGRVVAEQQNGDLRVRYAEVSADGADSDSAVLRLWLEGEADSDGVGLLYCGGTYNS